MSKLKSPLRSSLKAVAGTLLAFSVSNAVAENFDAVLPSHQAARQNGEIADLVAACNASGSCVTRYYLQSETEANSRSTGQSAGASSEGALPSSAFTSTSEAVDDERAHPIRHQYRARKPPPPN
jgi:hypothetical protein